MNNYRLGLDLVTVSVDTEEQNIALDRLKYFVYNQLSSSVFINQDSENCALLSQAGVRISDLPEEPIDQIIGIMLYCKLNAIMEDRMIVAQVSLSSELGDNIVYLHADEEALGPLSQPGWWNESDTSHCSQGFKDNKIVDMHYVKTWKDLNLDWEPEEPLEVLDNDRVLFADFNKDETR